MDAMEGIEVRIVDVRDVGPDTVAVTLEAPPGFDARPGQFVQLRATVDDAEGEDGGEDDGGRDDDGDGGKEEGAAVTRHYSISSPVVDETFELTIGVDPEGTLSPWLAGVSPGATVEVAGPWGRVYYADEPRVVVLAAGPGIGAAVGVAERAVIEGGSAAVVYRSAVPVHEDRLSALASVGADVRVTADDAAFEAAVASLLESQDAESQTFVYGFEPFVEDAREAILATGGDPDSAKVENYG